MRRTPALLAAIAIPLCMMAACSRGEDSADSAAPAGEASPETVSTPLPSGSDGHDYVCADGLAFNARIDRGNAVITVEGKTLTLAPTEGASGANYSGEGTTFIAMGEEAMLTRAGGAMQSCKAR